MLRRHPAIFFLGFVVVGIVTADYWHLPAGVYLCLGLAAVLAAGVAALRVRPVSITLFAISLSCVSAFHFALQHYDLGPNHFTNVLDESRTVQIFGQVADWPDLKAYQTELKVDLDSLGGPVGRAVEGAIILKVADTSTALQRGDRIEFWGRIYRIAGSENGSERFDYRRYLNMKGVFGIVYLPTLLDVRIDRRYQHGLYSLVDQMRDDIRASLYAHLSPQGAALAAGFLIGETRDIPAQLYQRFRDSGTLHLLAVSGSNVALVLLVIGYVLRPFGLSRRARAVALLGIIGLFALLSYGEPSVVRASVMAVLIILARLMGRRYDLNHIVAISMLIILLWDPAQFYDLGFQLSFGTAWGLVFFVPKITPLFERYHNRYWYRFLAFPVIISLVAQVFSTPLTLYYFGRLPVWSLPANLTIVPLVSMAVVGVMAVLASGLILPALGNLAGAAVDVVMRLLTLGVEFFGGGTSAVIEFDKSGGSHAAWIFVFVAYLLLVLAGYAVARKWARRSILALVLVTVNLWLATLLLGKQDDHHSALSVCRVPGGIAVLNERGTADLVVTSLEGREYPIDDRIIRPFLKARSIDSLRYLFVLGVSYQAVDDLLRLGDSLHIDSAYFPVSYRQLVTDAASEAESSSDLLQRVSYFPTAPSAWTGEGYVPFGAGVRLQRDGRTIVMSSASSLKLLPGALPQGSLVILGTAWIPTEEDCALLRSASARALICSRLAHPPDQTAGNSRERAGAVPPCPVYDLSRQNELVIRFSDSLRIDER